MRTATLELEPENFTYLAHGVSVRHAAPNRAATCTRREPRWRHPSLPLLRGDQKPVPATDRVARNGDRVLRNGDRVARNRDRVSSGTAIGSAPEQVIGSDRNTQSPHSHLGEAVYYAGRAAEWARARHAYARAAEYYQRALDALDSGATDPRQYAELLLALGHTQFVAGAVEEATATLERAFELTRARGRYDQFCRAILIWFQLRHESVVLDPVFHGRIAEALANVRAKDATFAQLQVARAMAMALTVSASERTLWVQEALALTQDRADPRARLDVLRGALRCCTRFPDGTSRLDLANEMLELATQLRSPENELEALQWKAMFLLELGYGDEYAQQVSDYARRAAIMRTPQGAWTASVQRVGQLFLAGDLIECERLAREAGESGEWSTARCTTSRA